jgi:hypothetical protein
MSNGSYYRLIIRFTNGETEKFVVRQPIQGGQISDRTRFVVVHARRPDSEEMEQVFVANLSDVSYVRTQRVEQKDMRHRVAGITGSIGFDDASGPEAIATFEFV